MMFSNKVYNILKWVSLVALDAVGLFYKTIATIWSFPVGDEVLATCTALSVLIGALIGVSSVKYNNTEGK